MAFQGTQANDEATGYGAEEINDDINNPSVDVDDYDVASELLENQDADEAKPPMPDSWPNAKGVYEPLIWTARFDWADADPEKQVNEYGEGGKKFRVFHIKGKTLGVNNEAVPNSLWENKPINFISVDTLVRDGSMSAVDFIKSSMGKQAGERAVREVKARLADIPLGRKEERANALNNGIEELVRECLQRGEAVKFRAHWHAQYPSDEQTKSGKDKWKTAKAGMKQFPKSEVFPCGHSPVVVAPNGLEVKARFEVVTWIPNRER